MRIERPFYGRIHFFQPAIEFLLQFFQQAPTMAAHPSVEPFLRPFQPDDRDALFKIAADTAYFGDPIEAYLEDRRIFLDAFYAYYTDLEPEHIWVAEAGGRWPVFSPAASTQKTTVQTHEIIRPRAWRKFLRGAYRIGPRGCDTYSSYSLQACRGDQVVAALSGAFTY